MAQTYLSSIYQKFLGFCRLLQEIC
ncbi:hypothetical protein MTR67_035660 [Solanum verrucosum]|uniref:Uncharacterized protein n=1 Tax=Solanum verrucosum TaxID=315347 RepID=A0AAF0ZLS6_SOLVR|nr:hypothetical protein MTR67_035660 [Solanum verrucosum]